MLPNLGLTPWLPVQARVGLYLSHWTTGYPKLEIWANWAYSKHFDHVFGRFTYLGQPVFMGSARPEGRADRHVRPQHLPRHHDSAYGPGWKRENSFLTHPAPGCSATGSTSTTRTRSPRRGRRPRGRARATALPCSARE